MVKTVLGVDYTTVQDEMRVELLDLKINTSVSMVHEMLIEPQFDVSG